MPITSGAAPTPPWPGDQRPCADAAEGRAQPVPITAGRDANVLYLSVLDYASGWREAVPSRAIIPELKQRCRT